MTKSGVKCRCLSLADTDIQKIDDIAKNGQIQSRSEVLRRLVDVEHRRLKE